MANENIPSQQWSQLKGEIQKTWGSLTGDELDGTHGNVKSIMGLLQKKLGYAQEEARRRRDKGGAAFPTVGPAAGSRQRRHAENLVRPGGSQRQASSSASPDDVSGFSALVRDSS